ncbi:MAG: GntR family transcriptional regulator, partial [Firmicutes bacterium]|nr:GntR family transcriptional regulator [Bacillota bacterium]
MARHKKFEDIAAVLREKILTGKLKPGQDFPSTLELIKEFEAHPVTIQNAVNALVREGLIITFGSGIKRRIVRPVIERSVRRGGFLDEFGSRAKLEILELDVTRGRRRLPETVFEAMEPPVLIYRTRQWRDGIPVALSDSFIPGNLPVYKLKTLLSDPGMDLYRAMKSVGL